jgi:hypothetical protein
MAIDWTQFWQVVVIPIGSGLAGFAQNNWDAYMADNKLDKFEWMEVIKTILKLGIPSLLLWLTLQGFDIDVAAWAPTLVVVTAYWITRLFNAKPPVAVKK